jgi:hypothetical protein
LHIIFADDAKQSNPARPLMQGRPFVAVGGFAVDGDKLRDLENSLEEACRTAGFPPRCEFKWSPPADNWMHHNLVKEERRDFFIDVLTRAQEHGATAFVAAEDTQCATATNATSAERDVLELFLERVSTFLKKSYTTGFVIADQPGGGRKDENSFLLECLEAREQGTDYVTHECLALSVVTAQSHYVRCLQLADLIVSATLGRITGNTYAMPIFVHILPLLDRDGDRRGGIGLKIQPAFRYANLYHWLLGDTHYWRMGMGIPLPSNRGSLLYSNTEND